MKLIGTKTYTITRPGASDFSTGREVKASSSTFTAELSLQEAKTNELAVIKDLDLSGRIIKGCVRFYATTELKESDTFIFRGNNYEVYAVFFHEALGLNHYKGFAVMVE